MVSIFESPVLTVFFFVGVMSLFGVMLTYMIESSQSDLHDNEHH